MPPVSFRRRKKTASNSLKTPSLVGRNDQSLIAVKEDKGAAKESNDSNPEDLSNSKAPSKGVNAIFLDTSTISHPDSRITVDTYRSKGRPSNVITTGLPQAIIETDSDGVATQTTALIDGPITRPIQSLPNSKQIILDAFVEPFSRLMETSRRQVRELQYHSPLDRSRPKAGKAKCHGIFIADILGGYNVYRGPRNLAPAIQSGAQWPVNEPLALIPAMAAATRSIGFGVIVSTSYEQPYHLARRLSTVDHLTGGRVGWNVVTGYLDSTARNLTNGQPQVEHDERYAICEEFMSVVYKLWNASWRSDAVRLDRESRTYTDPTLVREINHIGRYFRVPGPHLCQPSPQRTPVIMQAGSSRVGKRFAARHAEAVLVSSHSIVGLRETVDEIRALAASQDRDPRGIKILDKFCPVLGRTQAEAEAKFAEHLSYGVAEGALALFGGWTGIDMSVYADEEELKEVDSNAIKSYITTLMASPPAGGAANGRRTKRLL